MTPSFLAQSFPVIDFDYDLWLEARSESKHEYFYGHVYGKAGGSDHHSALAVAATVAFSRLLASKYCYVRNSELLIETPNSNAAFYPDRSIHCNQKPIGTARAARSPILILEILSSSTRDYDLTTKRKEYFLIPSPPRSTFAAKRKSGPKNPSTSPRQPTPSPSAPSTSSSNSKTSTAKPASSPPELFQFDVVTI